MKPINYLKNRTADLLREVKGRSCGHHHAEWRGEGLPDGRGHYNRWCSAMTLLTLLAQGEADVEAGRTVKRVDVFRMIPRSSMCTG